MSFHLFAWRQLGQLVFGAFGVPTWPWMLLLAVNLAYTALCFCVCIDMGLAAPMLSELRWPRQAVCRAGRSSMSCSLVHKQGMSCQPARLVPHMTSHGCLSCCRSGCCRQTGMLLCSPDGGR